MLVHILLAQGVLFALLVVQASTPVALVMCSAQTASQAHIPTSQLQLYAYSVPQAPILLYLEPQLLALALFVQVEPIQAVQEPQCVLLRVTMVPTLTFQQLLLLLLFAFSVPKGPTLLFQQRWRAYLALLVATSVEQEPLHARCVLVAPTPTFQLLLLQRFASSVAQKAPTLPSLELPRQPHVSRAQLGATRVVQGPLCAHCVSVALIPMFQQQLRFWFANFVILAPTLPCQEGPPCALLVGLVHTRPVWVLPTAHYAMLECTRPDWEPQARAPLTVAQWTSVPTGAVYRTSVPLEASTTW